MPAEHSRTTLVEVGPRDGFQAIQPLIPTDVKVAFIRRLYGAGLRRIEVAAFVSKKALPQMADAAAMVAAARELPGLDLQVLAPNKRSFNEALAAGVDHVAFVLSVSEKHNMRNVRQTPSRSAAEYVALMSAVPAGVKIRLNIATAFDCPFDGPVSMDATFTLLAPLIEARTDVEVALCDTTGRITPDRVAALYTAAMSRFPASVGWAFHGHDTYGLGVANVLAAYGAGVRIFDSSFGGLGGCPFAPGATGNVATEDVVWTFDHMHISTGVDLHALLEVAEDGVALPGAPFGGRVRHALRTAHTRTELLDAP